MNIPQIIVFKVKRVSGNLPGVLEVLGDYELAVESLKVLKHTSTHTVWELTIEPDENKRDSLLEAIRNLEGVLLLEHSDRVFTRHLEGKIKTVSKLDLHSEQELRDIYTPGVARVCLAIQEDPSKAKKYTGINNNVAVVTNGTAVLGLGDIGPVAGMPVMEGKAALFDTLVGLSGTPILIESRDPKKIIDTVETIAPTFGAIQLEDIGAPECFEIEKALIEALNVPVLHDDQHGTAVVALAALISAAREVGLDLKSSLVGQVGLGAAGIGISRLLLHFGVKGVLGADLNTAALKRLESLGGERSNLSEVMDKTDIVISTTGVKGLIQPSMVRKGQVILALTNPDPEIEPEDAINAGAAYAADGKECNNVLGFPGLFRGALEAGATRFTDAMLVAASECLSANAPVGSLLPDPLNRSVHKKVTEAVRSAASL